MKKLKLKKKFRKYIFILVIIILILIIKPFINKPKYDKAVFNTLDDNQSKEVKKKPYSKTLEEIVLNNIFIEEYYQEYLNITYQERNNFLNNVNTLLKKGYKAQEINNIYNYSDKNISKLLEKDYLDLNNYFGIKNFDVDKYDRYNEYYKTHKDEYKNIVTYVNIGVDLKPYTNTNTVEDPTNYLVLINKFNGLSSKFKPQDLVSMDGYYNDKVYIRKDAKEALEKLQKDIKNEIGTTLKPTTAYRGYSFQSTLYEGYVKEEGKAKADTYSARPGYSEHQTGLAIDLKNPSLKDVRLNDKDYAWLKENAHKYGFIIRFPKDKELLTGYQEENWHIRYVGVEHAKIIYEQNLCLEEYIDLYITQY